MSWSGEMSSEGMKTTGTTSGCSGTRTVVVAAFAVSPGSSLHDRVIPPWTLADALSGWPSTIEAMSLVNARSNGRSSRWEARESPCAAAMPVTMAVAEEPSPRPWGTALRHRRCRRDRLPVRLPLPRVGRVQVVPGGEHRPVDQVALVERHVASSLALHLDHQAGVIRDGRGALVPDAEREPDRVEAGAEVGAAGRHAHVHRGARSQPVRRALRHQPSSPSACAAV